VQGRLFRRPAGRRMLWPFWVTIDSSYTLQSYVSRPGTIGNGNLSVCINSGHRREAFLLMTRKYHAHNAGTLAPRSQCHRVMGAPRIHHSSTYCPVQICREAASSLRSNHLPSSCTASPSLLATAAARKSIPVPEALDESITC
jgi:hypothetical protein